MSREVTLAEEVATRVLRQAWGMASTFALLTASGLLVVHLVRKSDRGLVHLPWAPERKLYLGGGPAQERPPALQPVPAPLQPVRPDRPNLDGLKPLEPRPGQWEWR